MADAVPPSLLGPTKRLRCIVKLGGSAITHKNVMELINDQNLAIIASQLREAMVGFSTRVQTMDWSKRLGIPPDIPSDFGDQVLDSSAFIVVHGAGSFGHFQASRSGVHKGGLHLPLVTAGFVATRISVMSLNLEIVRALAREGMPSVGISPFSCGWSTCEKNIQYGNICTVTHAIDSGLIPVLHGDAVLDSSQVIPKTEQSSYNQLTRLTKGLHHTKRGHYNSPSFSIAKASFPLISAKTDVMGVYDRPPTDPNAILLREIDVNEDGSWYVVNPRLEHINCQVEVTVAPHDTTGGMSTKILEAAMIAKLGIDVYIVKAGTTHSVKALCGEVNDLSEEEWLGTAIRPAKPMHRTAPQE